MNALEKTLSKENLSKDNADTLAAMEALLAGQRVCEAMKNVCQNVLALEDSEPDKKMLEDCEIFLRFIERLV